MPFEKKNKRRTSNNLEIKLAINSLVNEGAISPEQAGRMKRRHKLLITNKFLISLIKKNLLSFNEFLSFEIPTHIKFAKIINTTNLHPILLSEKLSIQNALSLPDNLLDRLCDKAIHWSIISGSITIKEALLLSRKLKGSPCFEGIFKLISRGILSYQQANELTDEMLSQINSINLKLLLNNKITLEQTYALTPSEIKTLTSRSMQIIIYKELLPFAEAVKLPGEQLIKLDKSNRYDLLWDGVINLEHALQLEPEKLDALKNDVIQQLFRLQLINIDHITQLSTNQITLLAKNILNIDTLLKLTNEEAKKLVAYDIIELISERFITATEVLALSMNEYTNINSFIVAALILDGSISLNAALCMNTCEREMLEDHDTRAILTKLYIERTNIVRFETELLLSNLAILDNPAQLLQLIEITSQGNAMIIKAAWTQIKEEVFIDLITLFNQASAHQLDKFPLSKFLEDGKQVDSEELYFSPVSQEEAISSDGYRQYCSNTLFRPAHYLKTAVIEPNSDVEPKLN